MNSKNHDLPATFCSDKVRYETKPVRDPSGRAVDGLHAVWITLDNPEQLNSYTTEMVKDVILAFRRASNDRAAVAVVFTGAGARSFCTGGNTAEYATYYAGRPGEYAQYMRLFNDMVTSILHCDVPVICRVNVMRIAGGQEIGMACDVTVASDLATFGHAGPKHGSAPDGGATDFLPLFTGIERATVSCSLCEPWSAMKALQYGLVAEIVPVLHVDGVLIANPLVHPANAVDAFGRPIGGDFVIGAAAESAKQKVKAGRVDLATLDQAVDRLVTKFLMTMPNCLSKTIQSMRKHKLAHWDKNRESNRAWLALNMMTEAKAGFRAFHEGVGKDREVDFVRLRQTLAEDASWDDQLVEAVLPLQRAGGSS
ncbi:MAG: 6-oxocyclohex-1-ene-1-carbonyl-CoA hydratase [Planctomycetes bacterium]|nr:6-oxocyclohex-1-ene-1-carbonyl-CoA hydratase [Planctomycetota bacterium]